MRKHQRVAELIIEVLSESYKIDHTIVSSKDHGRPQNRPGTYIIWGTHGPPHVPLPMAADGPCS